MVDKHAIGASAASMQAKIERDGGIHRERVGAVMLWRINIPDREGCAALIHAAGAFAESIDAFLAAKWARQAYLRRRKGESLYIGFQDGTCHFFTGGLHPV